MKDEGYGIEGINHNDESHNETDCISHCAGRRNYFTYLKIWKLEAHEKGARQKE